MSLKAQEKARHEWISASSVNDFLALRFNSDRYYSFGDHLDYLLLKNPLDSNKKYYNIRLQLDGHTPQYKNLEKNTELNRPFFGWLHLNLSQIKATPQRYWKYGFTAGVSGPFAGAGDYQNGYHQLFLENEQVKGWENQTPNKLGLNVYLNFKQEMYRFKNHRFYLGSDQFLGNINTSFSPRMSYQYSPTNSNSYLPFRYNPKFEKGFAIEATVGWQYEFHNAALQGEYFSHSESYLADQYIYRSLFVADLGFRYSLNNWSVFIGNSINSVRIKGNKFHNYGIMGITYRWKSNQHS